MMNVGLISDTHGKLRSEVFGAFKAVELILHAGDVGSLDIISELEAIAPVHAVYGNTDDFDIRARCGAVVDIVLEGKRVIVVHGDRLAATTPAHLRQAYPDADVIVYGHTHKPLVDHGHPLVINPGAAGPARFKLKPSVAILTLPGMDIRFVDL